MGLRDKISTEQHSYEEEKAAKKRQQEESEAARVKAEVDALEKQKNTLLKMEQAINSQYEEAEKTYVAAKKKRAELKALIDENLQLEDSIFAEQGIDSVKKLANTEDYAEEDEVKDYKQSLAETVKENKQARTKKRRLATKLGVVAEDNGPVKKASIFEAIKTRVAQINEQIQLIAEQTPEGKNKKIQEIKQDIEQKYIHVKYSYSNENPYTFFQNLQQRGGINFEYAFNHISESVSENEVRQASKEVVEGWVEERINQAKNKAGLLDAQDDLRAIAELPENANNLKHDLRNTYYQIEGFIKNVSEKLGKENAEKIVRRGFFGVLNQFDYHFDTYSSDSDNWFVSRAEYLDEKSNSVNGMVDRRNYKYLDISKIEETLQEIKKLLAELKDLYESNPEQILQWLGQSHDGDSKKYKDELESNLTARPKYSYFDERPYKEGTKKFLEYKDGLAKAILETCLKEQAEIEKQWQPVRKQAELFFDSKWSSSKAQQFLENNRGLFNSAENVKEQNRLAEKLMSELGQARVQLAGYGDERVKINFSTSDFGQSKADLPDVTTEIEKLDVEIGELDRQILNNKNEIIRLENQIKEAWVKGALKEKKKTLEENNITLQEQRDAKSALRREGNQKIHKLNSGLQAFLENGQYKIGLIKSVSKEGQTVGELLNELERELEGYSNKTPTAEAEEVYETYYKLDKDSKEAQEKIARNRYEVVRY